MKKVVILGSSGSIGESALRVCAALPERLRVVGLAVNRRYERVLEQARYCGACEVAVADEQAARVCAQRAGPDLNVRSGAEGVEELAGLAEADIVLCALVGMAGLRPVLRAVERGTDVALATKEVLVAAGGIVTRLARATGARLLPVDSEHSAIFQCLQSTARDSGTPAGIKRLLLTASGGPFSGRPELDLDRVTVAEALDHPNWDMGRKVSVDSATLMNKGLEIIEARWLFDVPGDRIDVVLHPESVVHSMVEFVDSSVLAQLGVPDMRLAIQYALTWPDRLDGGLPGLEPARMGPLTFDEPDVDRFPCLAMAREAERAGGTMPAVLNAANEVAVERFLDGKLRFKGIGRLVASVTAKHRPVAQPALDDVLAADAWARSEAGALAGRA